MKNLTTLTVITGALLMSTTVKSQDLIVYRNGTEKQVKITEVTPNEIKFKNFNNQDGPLHVESKNDIFMIKYQNGYKEVLNSEKTAEAPAPQEELVLTPKEPVVLTPKIAPATPTNDEDEFLPEIRKYGGPRVGATFVGPGAYSDLLEFEGKRNIYSQFGWQFEKRLFTTKTGISGMVEFVPMIGGIDMGKFIPSASALIGIRVKNGVELGAGPNAAIYGYKNEKGYMTTSTNFGIVIAAGMSLKSDKVYFPINIAFIPSVGKKARYIDPATGQAVEKKYETGAKISLLVGFNYRKK